MDLLITAFISAPVIAYFSAIFIKRQQDNLSLIFSIVSLSCLLVAALWIFLPVFGYDYSRTDSTGILNFYLDQVSCLMLFMAGVVSFVVARFSIRYMDGDSRQLFFLKWLTITVTSVFWLIASGNLLIFFLSWLAVSTSLHKLLTFFNDRTAAIAAARRKFIVSRIGDISLLAGCTILASVFNTLSFQELFAQITVRSEFAGSLNYQIALLLISLGAIAKSAQIPFHSWLPETFEVPTPVSAIMHAGIINAGGYLIIRLSPLFAKSPVSGSLLTIVGAMTAVYAMLVMVTQTSVKKRLAYSTVGQMGFMIMQCGLGLYSLAMLHIVAHSFYKAYAFLRAGSAVEMGKQQAFFPKKSTLTQLQAVAIILLFLILLTSAWNFIDLRYVPLAAVWLSIFMHTVVAENLQISSHHRKSYLINSIFLIILLTAAYAGLARLFSEFLTGSVADSWLLSAGSADFFAITACTTFLFSLGFGLQIILLGTRSNSYIDKFAIHIHNGFYFKAYFDRLFHKFLPTAVITNNLRSSI